MLKLLSMLLKSKVIYIFVFALTITSLLNESLFSLIKKHDISIKQLRLSIKEAKHKSIECENLIKQVEIRIDKMLTILKEVEQKIPLRESSKFSYEFKYYDGDIITYKSDKGIGIKIKQKEKLFKSNKSLTYTMEGKYQYKSFKNIDGERVIQIYFTEYFFWKRNNQYGLMKSLDNGNLVYKYYAKVESGKVVKESIIHQNNDRYTIQLKDNKQIFYYSFNDNTSLSVKQFEYVKFTYSKDYSFTVWVDGNVSLSKKLSNEVFISNNINKSLSYIEDLIKEFPNILYSQYISLLLSKKIPLNKPNIVFLTLINELRTKYNLNPLKLSPTLNKLCKMHSNYMLVNRSKTGHIEHFKKKGYVGTTPFQRRKKMKYPYNVTEGLLYSDNIVRNFIKLTNKAHLIKEILNPKAIHLGYHQDKCLNAGKNGSFAVFLLGKKDKLLDNNHNMIIYPSNNDNTISPSYFYYKIVMKKDFCEPPMVKVKEVRNFLFYILFYDTNIYVNEVQAKVDNTIVNLMPISKQIDVVSVYTKLPIKAGKKYIVKIHYGKRKSNNKEVVNTYIIRDYHFLHSPY